MNPTSLIDQVLDSLVVLYEDNHLLVVEKPAGILSQKDIQDIPSMVEVITKYLKVTYEKPGNVYVGLVHRLDRNVGGVMVFAKTSKAAARLSEQIRHNTMQKQYIALVEGRLEKKQGILKHHTIKDEMKKIALLFDKKREDTKEAVLRYEVIKEVDINLSLYSYLNIDLITGRFHQIRAQLAFIGHPIYGDQKYKSNMKSPHLGLWCNKMTILHPITKEPISFISHPRAGIWSYL